MFHMITLKQMFVNNSLQKFLSLTAAVSNRIDSIRNLYIFFALDFPALENPISEKTNCRIQPSSHSSHASSSSSNQSGLPASFLDFQNPHTSRIPKMNRVSRQDFRTTDSAYCSHLF